ncbi:hypothetical protein BDV93DRAFT_416021, partial [Ceratobasidium sp. AG-I]
STNNRQIERLWLDVGTQFACSWQAFFLRLENLHQLDQTNTQHLWLLQCLFLDLINSDTSQFQESWNLHGVSGSCTNYQTPHDMRLLGQLENGVKEEIFSDVNPEVLQQFLGVDGQRSAHILGTTGAGAMPEDATSHTHELSPQEAEVVHYLRQQLRVEQETHVCHPPISVPGQLCPFNLEEVTATFWQAFSAAQEEGFMPVGYGLLEHEWEDGVYP